MRISHLGSIILLLLTIETLDAQKSIALTLHDMNGASIEQITTGMHCVVQVTVKNADLQLQKIEGFEKASSLQGPHVSRTMNIINGNRSDMVQYQYIVRFDDPGMYVIGPALFENKDVSNMRMLKVVEAVVEADEKKMLERKEPCYMVLKSDKKKIVVGERCTISVALYYQQGAQLEQVSNPVFEHCSVTPLEGKSKQETINGTCYYCLEQCYQICPEQVGTLAVPSIEAVIALPVQRRTWFGPRFSYQRIYSNIVKVTVEALPDPQQSVSAVAQIKDFKVICDQKKVELGQTIPINWYLTGDIGIVDTQLPALQLPDGIRYYPGKSSVTMLDEHEYQKKYEGVLQGIQPGDWPIASQKITYFDTNDRNYKHRSTKPFQITVFGNTIESAATPESPTQEEKKAITAPEQIYQDPCAWVFESWRAQQVSSSLSWVTFLYICLLVAGIGLSIHAHALHSGIRKKYASHYRRTGAYKRAQKQVHKAIRSESVENIYGIFARYIADRLLLPDTYASREYIKRYIQERVVDNQIKKELENYIILIERAAFYTMTLTTEQKKYILQQAVIMLRHLHTKVA